MSNNKLPYDTIAQAWDHFSKTVITRPISDWQRDEMKKVFYAGASCCFDIMTTGTDNLSEAEGVQRIESIFQEFSAFAVKLQTLLAARTNLHD